MMTAAWAWTPEKAMKGSVTAAASKSLQSDFVEPMDISVLMQIGSGPTYTPSLYPGMGTMLRRISASFRGDITCHQGIVRLRGSIRGVETQKSRRSRRLFGNI